MDIDVLSRTIGFVVLLFSLVVHENAHGISADYFGDPTARALGRVTMNPVPHIDPIGTILIPAASFFSPIPFIGWAKPVPVNSANLRNPLVHNAYVAAAGPASNFVLAFLGAVLWIVVGLSFKHIPGLMESGQRTLLFFNTLCQNLIYINCILGVFNLLPIPPLDGHWILMRYLPPGPREALASVGRFGFIILLLLLWTGVLWMIIGPPFHLIVNGYQSLVSTALRMF